MPSEYGVIPYEVDEITSFLETWLNENLPGLIEDNIDISTITTAVEDGLVGKNRPVLNLIFTQTDVNYRTITGHWNVLNNSASHTLCNLSNIDAGQNQAAYIGSFYVPISGTYTFYFLGYKRNDMGILHILVNGSDVAEIDCYNSTTLANSYLSVSLGTLTPGLKVVVLKVSDKNASSSSYGMIIHALSIMRDT
ncbi:hypothetical protein ES702_07145 [subsurface metagenome]